MGESWFQSSSLGESAGGWWNYSMFVHEGWYRLYAFVRIHRTVYQGKQVLLHVNFYKWKFLSNYYFWSIHDSSPLTRKSSICFRPGLHALFSFSLFSFSSFRQAKSLMVCKQPPCASPFYKWSSSKGLVHHLTSSIPGPQNKQLELQTGWIPCSSAKCVSSFKPPCPCACSAWKILFPSHFHIAW